MDRGYIDRRSQPRIHRQGSRLGMAYCKTVPEPEDREPLT